MLTFFPLKASASQSCPTGSFDIYSHNDPSRDFNFTGSSDLVVVVDQNGNCSGAIGWAVAGTPAFTELHFDEFSYYGDGWFDAWNTGQPEDKYTIKVDEDGNVQIFWGKDFHGFARRTSQPLRRIRITKKEVLPVTDVEIALEWPNVVWDWDAVSEFTGTTYFGQTGFASHLYGNDNFLYPMASELGGQQIIINKIDPRTYTGNVILTIWFKINGQDYADVEVLQNWSDSKSPEYIDLVLDTVGANGYWNDVNQRWEGNFLRPAPVTTPCPAPGPREVTIYQDKNFLGHCQILGVGEYPHSDVFKPVENDSLSALEVGADVSVTLYQDANYKGRQASFLGGYSYPNLDNLDFDNRASSMKVGRIR